MVMAREFRKGIRPALGRGEKKGKRGHAVVHGGKERTNQPTKNKDKAEFCVNVIDP